MVSRSIRQGMYLAVAAAALAGASVARALAPEQVAVIVNDKSEKSRAIAEHYMKARNIPAENLLTISVKPQENITDELYRTDIAAVVRKALLERKLDQKITCLVTTYDVPLRTDNVAPTPAEAAEKAVYAAHVAAGKEQIWDATAALGAMAPATAATTPATAAASRPAKLPDLNQLVDKLTKEFKAATTRVSALEGEDKTKALAALHGIQQKMYGYTGNKGLPSVTGDPTTQAEAPPEVSARMLELTKKLGDANAAAATDLKKREEQLGLEAELQGVVAATRNAEGGMRRFDHGETYACVDGELMLLWVNEYPREGMLFNPRSVTAQSMRRLRGEGEAAPTQPGTQPGTQAATRPERPRRMRASLSADDRILMTARLDGTSVEKVIKMIDTSIAVEKTGLDGVAYFDAGFARDGGIKAYDNKIIAAGEYLQQNAAMKVVIDKKPGLLKAQDCPDAAIYCGWYSLKNYQDSCQWLPGAVGYHIASYEMISLHDPHEFGWVAGLLDHGFCGTLGPGYEPYVNAFPDPTLFFPLLVSGQYTQGEVWYLTCPTVSWVMGYIGDPLYNPFFNKPRLSAEQIAAHPILKGAAEILPPAKVTAPIPPKPAATVPATTSAPATTNAAK